MRPFTRTAFVCLAAASLASAGDTVMRIAPVSSSVDVKGQPVSIVATGVISRTAGAWGREAYRVTMDADLSGLQQHLTAILAAQLNKSDPCGETVEIQNATFTPQEPAGVLTAYLHYERSLCAKAFGRQINRRMVAGNGVVDVKLTPAVEANKTVRLIPEVGRIEADGSLGEMLRSGSLGDRVREKIEESLVNSIQKASNLNGTLPRSIQDKVLLQSARFTGGGDGHLSLVVAGEINITPEQAKSLAAVLSSRTN